MLNTFKYKYPCYFDTINIEPTYTIDGIIRNHTYDQVTFNFIYPEDCDQSQPLKLKYSDKWGSEYVAIISGDSISLFEGSYNIEITDHEKNFIMPIKDNLEIYRILAWNEHKSNTNHNPSNQILLELIKKDIIL